MQLMEPTKEDYADRIIFNNNAAPVANYRHTHMLFIPKLTLFNSSTQQLSNEHYQL